MEGTSTIASPTVDVDIGPTLASGDSLSKENPDKDKTPGKTVPDGRACRRSARRMSVDFSFLKRKRRMDPDSVSLAEVDLASLDAPATPAARVKDPTKKRRSVLRTSSLANIVANVVSPARTKESRSVGGFKTPASTPAYKPPSPSRAKRRISMTWTESMASEKRQHCLSHHHVKRQEAIFELYQGEKDLIDDLNTIQTVYRTGLLRLKLLRQEEANQIFGPIESLIKVHTALAVSLEQLRESDGTVRNVATEILQWVPSLRIYFAFCANQLNAKCLLDRKRRTNTGVEEFLQRCLESSFSRKLDLWGLLDGARGRFMKYPLLIKAILKATPEDHEDFPLLTAAATQIDEVIREADKVTGDAECEFYKSQLIYTFDDQNIPEIKNSKALICYGTLRNTKGTKTQLYLFDQVAVVSRFSSQGQVVYRAPIPVSQLKVEDHPDGCFRTGSFRAAFSQGQTCKNVFRILFCDNSFGQSHTLIATDEHAKQQWMRSFQAVTSHIVHIGADKK